jgi:DNA repair exonuclease SbcCD ATPase subunit
MRLGPEAGTDLTVAAIAEAALLVTDDPAAAAVARAYGVPHVVPGEAAGAEALDARIRWALAEPRAGAAALDDELARLDAALDRLAEDARRAALIRSARLGPAAAAGRVDGADDASARLELARSAGEARARRLMGELARERERSAALEAALEEQAPMLDHVQAAYESLRTHVQVAQLRAEQAEATLGAAQLASAQALAATETNARHLREALEAQVAHFAATVAAQEAQIAQLAAERDAALGAAAENAGRAEAFRARAEALAAELADVRRTLETIVSSRSWRALAPARSAGEVMRRLSQ